MSDELLPCPFCGSKAERPEAMIEGCVTCSNGACPVWSFPFSIEQWNTRTPPAAYERLMQAAEPFAISSSEYIMTWKEQEIAKAELRAAIADVTFERRSKVRGATK